MGSSTIMIKIYGENCQACFETNDKSYFLWSRPYNAVYGKAINWYHAMAV